jgi:hypothetical protein
MSENWPQYQSHKIVRAAPIVGIAASDQDGVIILVKPGDDEPEEFYPNVAAMAEGAKPGDYAVVYEDGYRSISPKAAFEDGYTRIET